MQTLDKSKKIAGNSMHLSRRNFLIHSALAGSGVALSRFMKPSLLMAQSVLAAAGKNIVVINLQGGCDGLSFMPYFEGPLADVIKNELRPTIFIPAANVVQVGNQSGVSNKIGLHPSLRPLGNVAPSNIKIVQKYGIPPNDGGRSHDTCSLLMSLGASRLPGGESIGFLARLMDHENWESFQFWGIGASSSPDFNAQKRPPMVMNSISDYGYSQLYNSSDNDLAFMLETERLLISKELPKSQVGHKYLDTLSVMNDTVAVVRNEISTQNVGSNLFGNYADSGIGPSLKDAAKILKAKQSSLAFGQAQKSTLLYLATGGLDTHSDQNNPDTFNFSKMMGSLAGNLSVFIQDLKDMSAWNNTVIVILSEFGRSNYENGTHGDPSVGTDHAWGSNTIVMGGQVNSGVIGDAPSLSELRDADQNALIPTTDYRDWFSDVFNWIGVSPDAIFDPADYTPKSVGVFT